MFLQSTKEIRASEGPVQLLPYSLLVLLPLPSVWDDTFAEDQLPRGMRHIPDLWGEPVNGGDSPHR